MRRRPHLLILGLLTLLWCLPIASGQKGTVTVRQRVAKSPPGLPTVDVNVDRNRVPAGEEVTFTLSPANVVLNPLYTITLDFGDGTSTRAQQIKIIHPYPDPGIYTYRVSIKSSDKPEPPVVPRVSLSATPSSVAVNEWVNFKAQLSEKNPNLKYRFVFADGWVTKWQDSPTTEHKYLGSGTYMTYVDIGEDVQGSVKRLGGSIRQAIRVTAGPPLQVTVNLSAQPLRVAERQVVSFTARVPAGGAGVRYRFDFGDKSAAADWQAGPRARHRYLAAGTYWARVDVRAINLAGPQTASSSTVRIEVEAERPDVSLSASPNSVLENMPILFRANLNSSNSKIRYRFDFGDGSRRTEWTNLSVQPHVYTRQGTYAPSVEIARSNAGPRSPIGSSSTQVSVNGLFGPTPTPTPTSRPTSTSTPTPTSTSTSTSTPTPTSPSTSSTPTPTPTPTSTSTPSPVPASPTVDGSSSSPSASPPVIGVTSPSPGELTPTPNPNGSSGPLDNWWIYLLIALALFAIYQTWKWLTTPRPTFHPRLDPGVSEVGADKPLSVDLQVELNPDIATGQYGLEANGPSIIKSERNSND
jgi:PKD domain-containing protein